MTKQEREQNELMRQNQRMQKELSDKTFKQKARFEALNTAQYLRPPVNYINEAAGLAQRVTKVQPEYDVTKKAEEIYQWLIKVLK